MQVVDGLRRQNRSRVPAFIDPRVGERKADEAVSHDLPIHLKLGRAVEEYAKTPYQAPSSLENADGTPAEGVSWASSDGVDVKT